MKASIVSVAVAGLLFFGQSASWAACVGGVENGQVESGEQCDDGPANPCCTSSCTPDSSKQGVACNDYNDCSQLSSCNSTGQCVGRRNNDGQSCFLYDGVGTRIDCQTRACEGLSCTGAITNDPCSDNNPCTFDNGTYNASNPPTYCDCGSHVPLQNGALCDLDSNACTVDKCLSGACTYQSTITCTQPSNECRRKTCQPATGDCHLEDKPDGIPCTSDGKLCSADECRSGTCSHIWAQSGDPCDDSKYCTTTDGCYATSPWTGQAATNNLDCFGNPFALYQQPCNDGNVCSTSSQCGNDGACSIKVCATTGSCPTCQQACSNATSQCNCSDTLNAAP